MIIFVMVFSDAIYLQKENAKANIKNIKHHIKEESKKKIIEIVKKKK